MIHLEAIYNQKQNGRWQAEISEARHINVEDAEDLDTARVILRIITAEEVSQMHKNRRTDWDITKEIINYQNGNYQK